MDDEFVNAWWGTLINQFEEQKNKENENEISER
jgi:hypothetical protein